MNELARQVTAYTVWLLVAVIVLVSLWETFAPFKALQLSTGRRWISHLSLYIIFLLPQRLLRIGPVVFAIAHEGSRYGLLSRPEIPWILRLFAGILVLDLASYWDHRLAHTL